MGVSGRKWIAKSLSDKLSAAGAGVEGGTRRWRQALEPLEPKNKHPLIAWLAYLKGPPTRSRFVQTLD